MNLPLWVTIVISALTDFTIAAGSTLMGAIIESGNKAMPSGVVVLVAVLAGLIAAGKEVRSMLKLPELAALPKA